MVTTWARTNRRIKVRTWDVKWAMLHILVILLTGFIYIWLSLQNIQLGYKIAEAMQVQKRLKEEINELKITIAKMGKGIAISELIEEVKKHSLLGEFFDRERMKEQTPQEREQLSYKKNKEAIEKKSLSESSRIFNYS